MDAPASPPVPRDGPGGAEEQGARRFERYVMRLPDGRRLTLYTRPEAGPTVPAVPTVPTVATVRDAG